MIWLLFVILNIGLAKLHDHLRRVAIAANKTTAIKHGLWGALYIAACLPVYIVDKDWREIVSLLLLHISIFPVFFNRFSDLPAFNLSRTSKAITDRIMVRMKLKSTEGVNIAAFIISVGLIIWYLL